MLAHFADLSPILAEKTPELFDKIKAGDFILKAGDEITETTSWSKQPKRVSLSYLLARWS